MIEGIIFDFDGTIYDYELCNNKSLNKVFNYIHKISNIDNDIISSKYNEINKIIKNSNNYSNKFNKNIYFKLLLEELNISLIYLENIINEYEKEFNNNIKLFDNIIDIFYIIKNNNIKLGLLSNNNFKQQYDKLKLLNILSYFDCIYTSDEIGEEKPNINGFIKIINKMNLKNNKNIIYIGDNYENDIIPSIKLNLLSFYFNKKKDINTLIYNNNYFEFNRYIELKLFLYEYFKSINEFEYLAKIFGQSEINIQGQGGNLSIKINDNLMLIKSSGEILGNITNNNGYCIINNKLCRKLLYENNDSLQSIKINGGKHPSIETYFHCFTKKYTIHLHFLLANIFLCTEQLEYFKNLNLSHKIIKYFPPGIILAQEIYQKYDNNINVYFLMNHGIIITADTISEINYLYEEIFIYFNNISDNKFNNDLFSYKISKYIYDKFNKSIICREYKNIDVKYIKHIKYCFPDLVVYIRNILNIINLIEINIIPDIIIFNDIIYIIANNINKLYCMIETLNIYNLLCVNNYNKLQIIDEKIIENMEQEKYRKIN